MVFSEDNNFIAAFNPLHNANRFVKGYVEHLPRIYGFLSEEEKIKIREKITIEEIEIEEFRKLYPDEQINPCVDPT
jgi:hypothetical protein